MNRSWGRTIMPRALCRSPHTCPWWFAYTFDNPLRALVHDPAKILGGLVHPGQTVVDIGCGLGFFTLALAELVGPRGRVIAVDLQAKMLERNRRRAQRRGLGERIEYRQCAADRLGLGGKVDFALAFWMVHEVAQPQEFLAEIRTALHPLGHLLIAEPKGHVPESFFAKTTQKARDAGFEVREGPVVRFSRSILCSPLGG